MLVAVLVISIQQAYSQFLIEMIDTTNESGKGKWAMFKKYDNLSITGYFQPQFQVIEEKGARSYNGGNFPAQVNNRFMIRRGRIRFDYAHFTDEGKPSAQFVMQFDGTERGVNIRDFWGRIYENNFELFSFTTGMFARPFGYEINLSSGVRETPERGRMSQILMKTERDLGVMVSFEPRKKNHPLRRLKWDLGVFNGQGLAGPSEFDSYKDIISRLSLKPVNIAKKTTVAGGLSLLHGNIANNSKYIYNMVEKNGSRIFQVDSSASNYAAKSPRKYYGSDIQFKLKHKWGATELRGEYWWGTQTSTKNTTETPGEFIENTAFYRRNFSGAFVYFLQNIVNTKHQLGIKYDFYDPNTKIKGTEIGANGAVHTLADIKFTTLTVGYNHYFNDHLKMFLWYDFVKNESTSLNNYTGDVKDNVFTCRLQYTF